jgi:hypothetical protein
VKLNTSMVIVGGIFIVLALLMAIIPQFSSCQSQGSAISLPDGKTVPMKCYWTGQGELVLAVVLLVIGILLIVSRKAESQKYLSIVGILLGILAISLPTFIIGVCAMPTHICNTIMKTTLLILGPLVILGGLAGLILAIKSNE